MEVNGDYVLNIGFYWIGDYFVKRSNLLQYFSDRNSGFSG